MEKSQATVKSKYPDLTEMFKEKEKARIERARRPISEKIAVLARLRDLSHALKKIGLAKKGRDSGP